MKTEEIAEEFRWAIEVMDEFKAVASAIRKLKADMRAKNSNTVHVDVGLNEGALVRMEMFWQASFIARFCRVTSVELHFDDEVFDADGEFIGRVEIGLPGLGFVRGWSDSIGLTDMLSRFQPRARVPHGEQR